MLISLPQTVNTPKSVKNFHKASNLVGWSSQNLGLY
jgi:hypothetical protein